MMEESARSHNSIKAAIKYICGVTNKICRLCFASPTDDNQETYLTDIVTISQYYYSDTLTFQDLFKFMGISVDETLPQMLCKNCSLSVISAFLFKKLCEHSDQVWNQAVHNLSVSVPRNEEVTKSIKSGCLIVNDNINSPYIFSTKKIISYEDISLEINKMMNIRKPTKLKIKMKRIKRIKSKSHQCPKCDKSFPSAFILKDHIERAHAPKVLKCPLCKKYFSTERQVKRHQRQYHETATCTICDVIFPNKYQWTHHKDKHKIMVCQNCNRSFNNRNTFRSHKNVCGINTRYTCHHCNKSYCSKNMLSLHLREHGFGKAYACKYCDKKFYAVSRLKDHIVTHTKEKNFGCDICGGLFVSQASLIYHQRLHTGEKPYPCEMCEEKFISSSRRLAHVRAKHLAPTICGICQKSFTRTRVLKRHMEKHYNKQSRLYKPELDTRVEE